MPSFSKLNVHDQTKVLMEDLKVENRVELYEILVPLYTHLELFDVSISDTSIYKCDNCSKDERVIYSLSKPFYKSTLCIQCFVELVDLLTSPAYPIWS